jgi:hypothetical protein
MNKRLGEMFLTLLRRKIAYTSEASESVQEIMENH